MYVATLKYAFVVIIIITIVPTCLVSFGGAGTAPSFVGGRCSFAVVALPDSCWIVDNCELVFFRFSVAYLRCRDANA